MDRMDKIDRLVERMTRTVLKGMLYEVRNSEAYKDGWTKERLVKSTWLDVRRMPYKLRNEYLSKIHFARQGDVYYGLNEFKYDNYKYATDDPSVPNIEKMSYKNAKKLLSKIHHGYGKNKPEGNVSMESYGTLSSTPRQEFEAQKEKWLKQPRMLGNVDVNNPETWPNDVQKAFRFAEQFQNYPKPGAGWLANLRTQTDNVKFIKHIRTLINSYYAQSRKVNTQDTNRQVNADDTVQMTDNALNTVPQAPVQDTIPTTPYNVQDTLTTKQQKKLAKHQAQQQKRGARLQAQQKRKSTRRQKRDARQQKKVTRRSSAPLTESQLNRLITEAVAETIRNIG